VNLAGHRISCGHPCLRTSGRWCGRPQGQRPSLPLLDRPSGLSTDAWGSEEGPGETRAVLCLKKLYQGKMT
jgi:hypothetical protein